MCALQTDVEKNYAIRIKHGGFDLLLCVQISDEGRPVGMWVSKRDGRVPSYISVVLSFCSLLYVIYLFIFKAN